MRFFDQSNHAVNQRGNSFDFTRHAGHNFEGGIVSVRSHELCSQTQWNARFHNESQISPRLEAGSNHKLGIKLAAQRVINVAQRIRDAQETKDHEYRDQ
jgi:hypothetical protein